MARLEDRAVPGFRSNKTEELKTWLQDNGYLDVRDPLTPEEMRLGAIAMADKDFRTGRITTRQIDEYIATWFT